MEQVWIRERPGGSHSNVIRQALLGFISTHTATRLNALNAIEMPSESIDKKKQVKQIWWISSDQKRIESDTECRARWKMLCLTPPTPTNLPRKTRTRTSTHALWRWFSIGIELSSWCPLALPVVLALPEQVHRFPFSVSNSMDTNFFCQLSLSPSRFHSFCRIQIRAKIHYVHSISTSSNTLSQNKRCIVNTSFVTFV